MDAKDGKRISNAIEEPAAGRALDVAVNGGFHFYFAYPHTWKKLSKKHLFFAGYPLQMG